MTPIQFDMWHIETIRTQKLLKEMVELLKKIEQKVGPSDSPFKTYG